MSDDGQGYPLTPGVFTPAQIAGWKKITDAVHAKVRLIGKNKLKLSNKSTAQGDRSVSIPTFPFVCVAFFFTLVCLY